MNQLNIDESMRRVIDRVQVNIPFNWLVEEKWLRLFTEYRLNPEIGLDAATLDQYTRSHFEKIARRFHETGRSITLHGPFVDLSPGSPDPAIRKITEHRLEQAIAAAEVFSPLTVVCHAGYDSTRYGFIETNWYQYAADTWNRVGHRLRETGSRLMLENVYETDPGQLLRLFRNLDPGVAGCCLDIGHLVAFGKSHPQHWVETLLSIIGQLHLHDNDGSSDQHRGLGSGAIDIAPLADLFAPDRIPPVITLEPHEKDDLLTSLKYLSDSKWFR